MSDLLYWILFALAGIVLIVLVWFTLTYMEAEGQNATVVPPKAVTSPPNPTPTTPNPNFQYLPQKAFVLPFAPENGIPNTPPLNSQLPPTSVQPVPVTPAPSTQAAPAPSGSNMLGIPGLDLAAIAAAVGVYLKTRLLDKKTDKVEETTRENSSMIVKGAKVDKTLADQVYENMGESANKINDKPEIKLENLNKNIDEATNTTAKA